MSKRANPAVIGAFIVGALALVVTALIVFGSGKLFTKRSRAVMYFEGDVKGLRVGAPVGFRGVPIGSVTDIKALFDAEQARFRIPVVVEVVEESIETRKMGARTPRESLEMLVERGLRAQLQTESLVTGQLFVQLDLFPQAPPRKLLVDPDTNLVEIPTVPSTLQQVSETLMSAVNRLSQLPIEQIVTGVEESLMNINKLVNSAEVKESIRNFNQALIDVQQLSERLQKQVDPVAANASHALQDLSKLTQNTNNNLQVLTQTFKETAAAATSALDQTRQTMVTLDNFADAGSPIRYELLKTMRELSEAARSMRALTDYLERNPNAVFFGRKEADR